MRGGKAAAPRQPHWARGTCLACGMSGWLYVARQGVSERTWPAPEPTRVRLQSTTAARLVVTVASSLRRTHVRCSQDSAICT
jgi:hypothetical protein